MNAVTHSSQQLLLEELIIAFSVVALLAGFPRDRVLRTAGRGKSTAACKSRWRASLRRARNFTSSALLPRAPSPMAGRICESGTEALEIVSEAKKFSTTVIVNHLKGKGAADRLARGETRPELQSGCG